MTIALVSVPYAIAAEHAAISDRLGSLAEEDVVTSVTGSGGILGGGSGGDVALSLDSSVVQARVDGTCPAGQYIRVINTDGTVTCQADVDTNSGGDISAVTAGTGLTGGGASGAVTLAVDTGVIQQRVTGSCSAGQYMRAVAPDGTVTCQADGNAGGDITEVTTAGGSGLSGGATSGAVALSIANGGVNTARIADGAVTMAKTSAPIGVFTGSGTLQAAGSYARIVGGGFTADSNGACFVPAARTPSFRGAAADGSLTA